MSNDADPVGVVLLILTLASIGLSATLILRGTAIALVAGLLLCAASLYSFKALFSTHCYSRGDLPLHTKVLIALTAVAGVAAVCIGCCGLFAHIPMSTEQ
jgi:hypothetical protein